MRSWAGTGAWIGAADLQCSRNCGHAVPNTTRTPLLLVGCNNKAVCCCHAVVERALALWLALLHTTTRTSACMRCKVELPAESRTNTCQGSRGGRQGGCAFRPKPCLGCVRPAAPRQLLQGAGQGSDEKVTCHAVWRETCGAAWGRRSQPKRAAGSKPLGTAPCSRFWPRASSVTPPSWSGVSRSCCRLSVGAERQAGLPRPSTVGSEKIVWDEPSENVRASITEPVTRAAGGCPSGMPCAS